MTQNVLCYCCSLPTSTPVFFPGCESHPLALEQDGVTVLDIGTGTGILAVMAARAGASRVFACEVNGVLCDVAREVLERYARTKDRDFVLSRTCAECLFFHATVFKYNTRDDTIHPSVSISNPQDSSSLASFFNLCFDRPQKWRCRPCDGDKQILGSARARR